MIFFDRRKQKKLLAELKDRRRAEDDLLSPALRVRFDEIISDLESASGKDVAGAVRLAQQQYEILKSGADKRYGKLPARNILYVFLDLVFVESAKFSTIIARKFGAALPQLLSSVAVDVLAVIYAEAIVLMLIGWILKRKEKKAE